MDAAEQEVVTISRKNLCYTLSPEHRPVATVSAGSTVRIETELNIGDVLHSADDKFDPSMIRFPYVNGATGPIASHGCIP